MSTVTQGNPFEDLRVLYQRARDLLVESAKPLQELVNGGYLQQMEDRTEVNKLAAILRKDIEHYSATLTRIHNKHKGFPNRLPVHPRKTSPKHVNPMTNQVFDAWKIGTEYTELIGSMSATLTPIAVDLMTLIEHAQDKEGARNE